MDASHILAAGGIVVRFDPDPRIAVVQLRRRKAWVLPKGKLSGNESAVAAARREVLEETGHKVSIHEFVGAISYKSRGKPKIVQFWRMQARGSRTRKLMDDVKSVSWLPLEEAVALLTDAREKLFLADVGPRGSAPHSRACCRHQRSRPAHAAYDTNGASSRGRCPSRCRSVGQTSRGITRSAP